MNDLILFGGQSNMRGTPGYQLYKNLVTQASNMFFGMVPHFAVEYHRLTGRTVDTVNARVGGTAQTREAELARPPSAQNGCWDREGTLWQASVDMVAPVLPGHTLRAIVWCQGEADAEAINDARTTQEHYLAGLTDMIARYREHFGMPDLPFLIVRSAYTLPPGDTIGFQQVRAAQDAAAEQIPGVHLAFAGAVTFPERGMMVDQVHWDTPALIETGKAVAAYAAALFPGELARVA